MEETMIKGMNHASQYLTKMSPSQAIVLGFSVFALYALLNTAFENGWAPDIDFKNGRVRFVHVNSLTSQNSNEE